MASGSKKKDESTKERGVGFDLDELHKVMEKCFKEDSLGFLEKVKTWSPGNERKLIVEKWQRDIELREESEQIAEMEMWKKLRSRTPEEFQRKSYDEGDQSALVGRDAWTLQWQWSHKMNYSPLNPHFSEWMKVIYTGNYPGMMDILQNTSNVKKLLSMRESLMNMPALLHVVLGATVIHTEDPSLLAEKIDLGNFLDVKYDHLKILEKLIELGADLTAKDVAGRNFLHNCFGSATNPTTRAMAELVLKAGLDPNIQDRFGFTALFGCTDQRNLTDMEILLRHGADPFIKAYEMGNSCHFAAQKDPAMNKLINKYMCRDALKERNKLKEEHGGSLRNCLECGKSNADRCKGCFVARYCSRACQKNGWKVHKTECQETRAKYRSAVLHSDSPFLRFIPLKDVVVDQQDSPRESFFVVKVLVLEESKLKLGNNNFPLLVHNRGQTLRGSLEREEGQEELYDKLKKEVTENGFNSCTGFFPAIYQKDNAEGEGYKLEINPDQLLPVEVW